MVQDAAACEEHLPRISMTAMAWRVLGTGPHRQAAHLGQQDINEPLVPSSRRQTKRTAHVNRKDMHFTFTPTADAFIQSQVEARMRKPVSMEQRFKDPMLKSLYRPQDLIQRPSDHASSNLQRHVPPITVTLTVIKMGSNTLYCKNYFNDIVQ